MTSQQRDQPADVEAETSIIAAVLTDGQEALDMCDGLQPEHFFVEAHRRVFEAAIDVAGGGGPVDVVSIAGRLRDTGRLAQVGGTPFLASLRDSFPDRIESVAAYSVKVREKASLRRLVSTCERIIASAHGDTGPVLDFLDNASTSVESISRELFDGMRGDDDAITFMSEFKAIGKELQDGTPRDYVTTGIRDLDEDLGGFEYGFVTVLGAPTNWGKSGCVVMFIDEALKQGKKVLVVTFEDKPRLYIRRLAARRGKLNAYRLKNNTLTDAEFDAFALAAKNLCQQQAEPSILKAIGRPIESVVRRIDRMCKTTKYDLIVFDYLQRAKSIERHGSPREHIDFCLHEMLDVIKTNGCAGLIISQMHRKTAGEEPTLSDLKESGDIEICAEAVLLGFIDKKKAARLRLAKSKDGQKMIDYSLSWDPSSACIIPGERAETGFGR